MDEDQLIRLSGRQHLKELRFEIAVNAAKYWKLRKAVIDYKRALEAGEAYSSVLACEATKDLFELVNDDKEMK